MQNSAPSSQALKTCTLSKLPNAAFMLLRAGLVSKTKTDTPELVPSCVEVNGLVANAKQLARFREVCGFRENGQLPITFPQVMSTALQIKLMLEPEFPFNPIGVVHLRNEISQTRVLTEDEALDFNVATSPMRTTPTGYEVDFVNSVSVAGEQVWQAIATVLIRRKLGTSKPAKREHQKGREYAHVETWGIPGNRGRRYAKASGDFNPIHLYTATAKMLGFRRHIAHGMWSKSRCIAHLWDDNWNQPLQINAAFKLPVYLPAKVTMMHEQEGDSIPFEMRGPTGRRPHVVGEINLAPNK